MSYSFLISAGAKAEAVAKVEAELAKVVSTQPSHEADRQAARNAAEAFIGVLAEPSDTECVVVSVSGSLSWREEGRFINAAVSINANLQTKV